MNKGKVINHNLYYKNQWEEEWRKLIDTDVVAMKFSDDSNGRFCSFARLNGSIELWDFSSIPTPMTALFLPESMKKQFQYDNAGLGNKPIFQTIAWSQGNKYLCAVFGADSKAKKIQQPKNRLLVTWEISSQTVVSAWRYYSENNHFITSKTLALSSYTLLI